MPQNIPYKVRGQLAKLYNNAEVILFGSRARGDNQKDSDWDFLILIDQEEVSLQEEAQIISSIYEIELDTSEVISALIYPRKYWETILTKSPLYNNINHEGIKIK